LLGGVWGAVPKEPRVAGVVGGGGWGGGGGGGCGHHIVLVPY